MLILPVIKALSSWFRAWSRHRDMGRDHGHQPWRDYLWSQFFPWSDRDCGVITDQRFLPRLVITLVFLLKICHGVLCAFNIFNAISLTHMHARLRRTLAFTFPCCQRATFISSNALSISLNSRQLPLFWDPPRLASCIISFPFIPCSGGTIILFGISTFWPMRVN